MDDQRIGAAFRAIRVRKGWRQRDLARRAGVSQATVSRIERGVLSGVPLGTLRAVAIALEAQFDPLVRWHGGDLPRLLGARHAALHEAASRLFGSLDGWLAEPEVSFSIYGERGVIDVFAWHAATRSLLVVELKTEFVDVNELMGTLDRKRRLAPVVAQDRGWAPLSVSTWVLVADSRTNRRVVAAHVLVLRSKLPVDGRTMRAWVRGPVGRVDALTFLPSTHQASRRTALAPVRRVRSPAIRRGRDA